MSDKSVIAIELQSSLDNDECYGWTRPRSVMGSHQNRRFAYRS